MESEKKMIKAGLKGSFMAKNTIQQKLETDF